MKQIGLFAKLGNVIKMNKREQITLEALSMRLKKLNPKFSVVTEDGYRPTGFVEMRPNVLKLTTNRQPCNVGRFLDMLDEKIQSVYAGNVFKLEIEIEIVEAIVILKTEDA